MADEVVAPDPSLRGAEALLRGISVVPVVTIEHAGHAVPLASALVAGGLTVVEVTMRTPAALEAIRLIRREVRNATIAAGTVLAPHQLEQAAASGASFAFSPGATPALLQSDVLPLVPGVATASEIMVAADHGHSLFKLFPATAVGGVAALKSFAGPFPGARFCPTGGVDTSNMCDFLRLPNVACIGSSWIAPPELIRAERWAEITARARAASQIPSELGPPRISQTRKSQTTEKRS